MKKTRREKTYHVKMDEDEKKDPVIREFLTKDLGDDMRKSGVGKWIVFKNRQRLTSIFLDPQLVVALREKAAKRGMGYQTLLKMIVHDHIHEY